MKRFWILMMVVLLAACSGRPSSPVLMEAVSSENTDEMSAYHLAAGDFIHINVFDEANLSGEFRVNDTGHVLLPLAGPVFVRGLTVAESARQVEVKLKEGGYLVNPKVSVQILKYRPFYIIGEVQQPGRYDYTDNLTLLNAIALSGGFTYRADKDDIDIQRGSDILRIRTSDGLQTPIQPGDVIQVPERYF